MSNHLSKSNSKPKILFFCGERSPWGYAHLEPLITDPELEVVGTVIATDERWRIFRKALSGEEPKPPSPFTKIKQIVRSVLGRKIPNRTELALNLLSQHNVPILTCENVNSAESINLFKSYKSDLIFSAAYPQIFKSELLSVGVKGAFNSHPSLLPRCRGAHPVFWAIASGETKSGATIHYMTKELDQGDIVAQLEVELLPTDTYRVLYDRLTGVVSDLLAQFTTRLQSDCIEAMPQNSQNATYFRNDRTIHHRIFWSEMTAEQINNLVRACHGKAFFWLGDKKLRVQEVEVKVKNRNMTNGITVPPGTVVDIRDFLPVVATKNGFVYLKRIYQPYLKKKIMFEIGQIIK